MGTGLIMESVMWEALFGKSWLPLQMKPLLDPGVLFHEVLAVTKMLMSYTMKHHLVGVVPNDQVTGDEARR